MGKQELDNLVRIQKLKTETSAAVARMQARSAEIRGDVAPDCAALHPGYAFRERRDPHAILNKA